MSAPTLCTFILFVLISACASTAEKKEDSRNPSESAVIHGAKSEFEGRYRFKLRTTDGKPQFTGWWGEMLITRDRMMRMYRSQDGAEIIVDYGRIQTLQPQVIEYKVLQFSPAAQASKYTNNVESYQITLDPESSLTLKGQTKAGEMLEEWIPVGISQ